MKVLIADDEAPARLRLRRLVEELAGCEVVAEAGNGREALLLSERLKPDVLLLDIRMPGMDGLEAARHLAALDEAPAVIFTTAFGEHALEAFDAHALDYLLKPIRKERLAEALQHARKLGRARSAALAAAQAPQARTHICARVRGELQLVPVEEVVYFLADQKYVTVRHGGGEVLIEESLKALEQEFGARFIRIHRNALVNAARITALERAPDGSTLLRLRGVEERLEVSRRHVAAVRQWMTGLRHAE